MTAVDEDKFEKLLIDVAIIKEKLDTLVSNTDTKLQDHESRLRRLEQNMWRFFGIAAIGGPVLSFVIAIVFKKLGVL